MCDFLLLDTRLRLGDNLAQCSVPACQVLPVLSDASHFFRWRRVGHIFRCHFLEGSQGQSYHILSMCFFGFDLEDLGLKVSPVLVVCGSLFTKLISHGHLMADFC